MNKKECEKYALVTGASSGIGYEYAREMARRGYALLMVSNEEAIEEKGKEIERDWGVKVIALVRDLGRQEAAKDLYDYCVGNEIDVEVLINNAGVYHNRDFVEDSEEFNSLILNLHVYTPTMLIYYFGQEMVKRGKGYVLNMSSVTANVAVQKIGAYAATKAYLKNFSRSIHIELREKGVIVTAVCPGAVATTLYNLNPTATKIGLTLGYIVTPRSLAQRGVRAMMRGRAKMVPPLWHYLLLPLIALIPTWILKLIRKWGWY